MAMLKIRCCVQQKQWQARGSKVRKAGEERPKAQRVQRGGTLQRKRLAKFMLHPYQSHLHLKRSDNTD